MSELAENEGLSAGRLLVTSGCARRGSQRFVFFLAVAEGVRALGNNWKREYPCSARLAGASAREEGRPASSRVPGTHRPRKERRARRGWGCRGASPGTSARLVWRWCALARRGGDSSATAGGGLSAGFLAPRLGPGSVLGERLHKEETLGPSAARVALLSRVLFEKEERMRFTLGWKP